MWSRSSFAKNFEESTVGSKQFAKEAKRKVSIDTLTQERNSDLNDSSHGPMIENESSREITKPRYGRDSADESCNGEALPKLIKPQEKELSAPKTELKYFAIGKTESQHSVADRRKSDQSFSETLPKHFVGPHHRMREQLRYTKASTSSLRYVIYLTVSFVLCTAPTMGLLSVDILSPNLTLNMVILNSCLMCPFIYCYLCPFILVKCLPGVKTSLSALILSVYSTSD